MKLTLPWPPSVNNAYRSVGGRILISSEGRAYRDLICRLVRPSGVMLKRLRFWVTTHQPDARERDLGNLDKCLADALQHAGVYERDGQIDDLRYMRGSIDRDNPRVEVEITELPGCRHG